MGAAGAWAKAAKAPDAGLPSENVLREKREFSIESLPLEEAALRFSERAGIQLLMNAQAAVGLRSQPLRGRYRIDQALDLLLASSMLRWRRLGERTVTIEPPGPQEAPVHLLGPVRIEAEKRGGQSKKSWDDAVLEKMDRHKRYPLAAQQRGMQDVVYVRILVDAKGNVLSSYIVRSRGFQELDRAVIDLVRDIDPLPPLPDGVTDKRYGFVVPVEFFLKEVGLKSRT